VGVFFVLDEKGVTDEETMASQSLENCKEKFKK
jgi:hypothetical protein